MRKYLLRVFKLKNNIYYKNLYLCFFAMDFVFS